MPIAPLRKIYTKEPDLTDIQTNVEEVLKALVLSDFINGNILTTQVKTTDTFIEHKLMRQFKGWLITDKTANVDVWRVENSKDKTKFITLRASSDCTITIYVF